MRDSLAMESVQGPPLAIVAPPSNWVALDLKELWQFRELLLTFGWRDLKLRYRQTFLGVAWVILQPLFGAGIFSFVFGNLAKLPSDGVPYFLFSFASMMGWNAFQTSLTKSSMCLIGNANLVSKVYFPRIALPFSTVLSALVDFSVALPVLGILILVCSHVRPDYHFALTWKILLVPVWLLVLLMLAQGIGLFCSALTVQYRDVQYIVPVVVQFLLFGSPVNYSTARIMDKSPLVQHIYFLDPLAGLITAFRACLLGTHELYWGYTLYAVAVTLVILVAGAFSFRRMEQRFADVI